MQFQHIPLRFRGNAHDCAWHTCDSMNKLSNIVALLTKIYATCENKCFPLERNISTQHEGVRRTDHEQIHSRINKWCRTFRPCRPLSTVAFVILLRMCLRSVCLILTSFSMKEVRLPFSTAILSVIWCFICKITRMSHDDVCLSRLQLLLPVNWHMDYIIILMKYLLIINSIASKFRIAQEICGAEIKMLRGRGSVV